VIFKAAGTSVLKETQSGKSQLQGPHPFFFSIFFIFEQKNGGFPGSRLSLPLRLQISAPFGVNSWFPLQSALFQAHSSVACLSVFALPALREHTHARTVGRSVGRLAAAAHRAGCIDLQDRRLHARMTPLGAGATAIF